MQRSLAQFLLTASYPIHYLADMLKVAFGASVALALFRRECFADADLNGWDEHWGISLVRFCLIFLKLDLDRGLIQFRSVRRTRLARVRFEIVSRDQA